MASNVRLTEILFSRISCLQYTTSLTSSTRSPCFMDRLYRLFVAGIGDYAQWQIVWNKTVLISPVLTVDQARPAYRSCRR